MRDLHNNISVDTAFDITEITSDTTTEGNIIDSSTCNSLEFIILSGVLTDGIFVPEIVHGDESDLSDAEEVPDNQLIGTETSVAFIASEDNKVKKIGYIGNKRYIRLDIRSELTSVGGTISAIAAKGYLDLAPDTKDYTS